MSGVFVLTGKLGSGKTLYGVKQAVDAIRGDRRVATNINLHLSSFLGRKSKRTYTRLPDKPGKADLECLGMGSKSRDENTYGVILLDECAHWLNARNWQDKSNQEMIQFLIYIRKLRWKVYFIVQDISALDKQARKLFAEHVVYLRRMDRMRIPWIGWALKPFGITAPKAHVATIRYGDLPTSPLIGSDWFTGKIYYDAYDTEQIFRDDYPYGIFSPIPNFWKKRPPRTRGLKLFMGLSKIYLQKHIKTSFLLAWSVCLWALFHVYVVIPNDSQHRKEMESLRDQVTNYISSGAEPGQNPGAVQNASADISNSDQDEMPLVWKYESRLAVGTYDRVYMTRGEQRVHTDQLRSMGYTVRIRDCSVVLVNNLLQERDEVPIPCS